MAERLPDWQPWAYVTDGRRLLEIIARKTHGLDISFDLRDCVTDVVTSVSSSVIRPSSSFIPRSSWRLVRPRPQAPDTPEQ